MNCKKGSPQLFVSLLYIGLNPTQPRIFIHPCPCILLSWSLVVSTGSSFVLLLFCFPTLPFFMMTSFLGWLTNSRASTILLGISSSPWSRMCHPSPDWSQQIFHPPKGCSHPIANGVYSHTVVFPTNLWMLFPTNLWMHLLYVMVLGLLPYCVVLYILYILLLMVLRILF